MLFLLNPLRIVAGICALSFGVLAVACMAIIGVAVGVLLSIGLATSWALASPMRIVVWNVVALSGLAVADHYGYLPPPPVWLVG